MSTTYGLWTTTSDDRIYKDNKVYFACRCECGTEREVCIKNLKSGISTSCGCKNKAKLIKRNTRHNKRFTKEWRAWQAMKNRCYNKNTIGYHNYGGRGITVREEWRKSFMSFYNYVGDAPANTSLDRIDNEGNYEPGNVRWATKAEQSRNRRSNKRINGVCISDISRSLGGNSSMVGKRLRRGWSLERAVIEQTHAQS